MILWHGNTQALTTAGQYELCGKVLDIAEELGCRFVISIGGFKKDETPNVPVMYSAATDQETVKEALDLGTKMMVGHIFGVAGILIGMCRLRKLKGFALLVDTLGMYPDANAARYALTALGKFLGLNVDLSRLDVSAGHIKKTVGSFWVDKEFDRRKEERGAATAMVYLALYFAHELFVYSLHAFGCWA